MKQQSKSKELPLTKKYVFNETGNIMLTTIDSIECPIKEVRDIFEEVSVFFAAMIKAITSTINPETKKPYSPYNYSAINKIVNESGLFVPVWKDKIQYESDTVGVQFSSTMVKSLLGMQNNSDSLPFAPSLVSSIGKECIEQLKINSGDMAGTIFFVCEYLMGLPIISAILVYLNPKVNSDAIDASPCTSKHAISTNWVLHKDTYLFVTPNFIRKFKFKTKSVTDSENDDLIDNLKTLIKR